MRYLPLTDADRRDMLAAIGVKSIDDLFAEVPQAARHDGLLDLPRAMGELEVERRLGAMAAKNIVAGAVPFFLGAGSYRHHVPAAVDHLIQRGEFLTSYTPYQPELAQGTLQYLFEFQTQVALLTGMEVANASLYDGGPYVGLFASREKFVRQMPGRLVGETADAEGRRGWVLTLSTREQHIRREKATSNICTNSGLCALAFTIHLSLLGEAGLTRLARLNHATAVTAAERLAKLRGVKLVNQSFFNEFALRLSKPAAPVVETLAARGILAGVPVSRFYPERAELADLLLVAATETVTADDIERLAAGLAEALR